MVTFYDNEGKKKQVNEIVVALRNLTAAFRRAKELMEWFDNHLD